MTGRRRGINVHRFLEGYGVRCRPVGALNWDRKPNTIYGGRTIARLLHNQGEDHTGLVVLCIQASNPTCFHGDTMFAVSRFLRTHRPAGERLSVVNEFRGIDIGKLRERAQRLAGSQDNPMARRRDILVGLIADRLTEEEAA